MKKLSKYSLLLIVILGALLRIFAFDLFPPSLNWDEISHGFNAFSILKTGRDEWGMFFPLIFRAFGDYKLPLYIYLTTLPVALLGLSAFSTRLISVLAGIAAIPGIYLLTNSLFPAPAKGRDHSSGGRVTTPGLVAAFLLAISPWHFFISRPALEANLGLTLFIFAAYFLLSARENSKLYLPSSILFALTLHTYNSYRVLTPIFLLIYFLIYHPDLKLKKLVVPTLIFLASLALVVSQVLSGTGAARYKQVAILSDNAVPCGKMQVSR